MSGTERLSGWLPIEAMATAEEDHARRSAEFADQLIDLAPRARVARLLRLALAEAPEERTALLAADLARVLASFGGDATDEEAASIALWEAAAEAEPPPLI
jgi:hypothetical protein